MSSYLEVITDAATGRKTTRPFTTEEIAAIEAARAAAAVAGRASMRLTFAQLLIGLVAEGWVSEADGEAWLSGALPAPVAGLIGTLPQGQRFAARARALRPSEVLRLDPLLLALGAATGKTPEEIDQFFLTYAQV